MNPPRQNLFYALWPDEATQVELARLQDMLRGRLTRPANLHLTLAFLGPQPDALMPILLSILSHMDAETVDLEIDRLGYFAKNRIAWAGMGHTPPALLRLHGYLAQELTRKGIPFEAAKTFRPHITLARKAESPPDLPFVPFCWRADRVVLAQSPAPGEKPLYQILAEQACRPAFHLE